VTSPVLLTNQVVMVGYALPPALLRDLVTDHGHVVALNTSDRDDATFTASLEVVGRRVPVYVGVIGQLVRALERGAAGALCFEADLVPVLCRHVCAAHHAGDHGRRDECFALLLRVNDVLSRYQNPRSVKAAMEHLGLLAGGTLRRPYLPLDDAARDDIGRVVDDVVTGATALVDR
jgi:dihydrodipicolinate synthase/N-acetylneuraminate lyase